MARGAWLGKKNIKHLKDENIIVGKYCHISKYAYLDKKHGKLKIGNNVVITAWAKILTHDDSDRITGKKHKKTTIIKDNAWIGLNAIVLTGITIGKNSVVGAGSVVTKDIPDGEIWAGNPAKKIGKVNEEVKNE